MHLKSVDIIITALKILLKTHTKHSTLTKKLPKFEYPSNAMYKHT